MTNLVSAGVYTSEIDQSFIVPASASAVGGIVVASDRGVAGEVTLVTSPQELIAEFGVPASDSPSMHAALTYLKAANRLYVTRAINDAVKASFGVTDGTNTVFTVNAKSEGAWGNGVSISTSATVDGVFTLTVKEGNTVEVFKVSRDVNKKDGFGKSMYIEEVVNNQSKLVRVVDVPTEAGDAEVLADQAISGGLDDTAPVSNADINTAWDLFAVKEDVPVGLLIDGGWADPVVALKMLQIAENRKDCVALLDVPVDRLTATDIETYSNSDLNADSSFGALYAGWLKVYDQFSDREMLVPPSAFAAAAIARVAANREVWYAAAGPQQGRVVGARGVHITFSEGDRDVLYTANVNPIQSFRGEGIQIYGQKTLQRTPSALDRLNVRLTMVQIEKDIARALRAFVFQFNDSFTRDNIRAILDAYLGDVQSRRGLYEFLVVADESNNTPQVIDNNELRVDVYVKPVRVAEFVSLNAIISATGATLSQG